MPPIEQHQQGQHRGEDRPADEEVDHDVVALRRWRADRRRVGESGRSRPGGSTAFRSGWPAASAAPAVHSSAPGGRPGRRAVGASPAAAGSVLTVMPGADQLQPLDDHRLAGFEARFEDAQALVGEGRPDAGRSATLPCASTM